jgi:hypothetical protein
MCGSKVVLKQPLKYYHFGGEDPGAPSAENLRFRTGVAFRRRRASGGRTNQSQYQTDVDHRGCRHSLRWGVPNSCRVQRGFDTGPRDREVRRGSACQLPRPFLPCRRHKCFARGGCHDIGTTSFAIGAVRASPHPTSLTKQHRGEIRGSWYGNRFWPIRAIHEAISYTLTRIDFQRRSIGISRIKPRRLRR